MSACVSPPQESTSHIVDVAASIAQAASTALPPRSNMRAPAVAASGLPVIAIQCEPCSGGFCVFSCASAGAVASSGNEDRRGGGPKRMVHRGTPQIRSFTPSRSSRSSLCVASMRSRLNSSIASPCTTAYCPSLQVTGYE